MTAHPQTTHAVSADEVERRVAAAEGIAALAGSEPSEFARSLSRQVAAGEITDDEAVARAAAHHGVTLG